MHEPSLRLPRGVIPGAILALVMIAPLVAAIALDVGYGHRSAELSGSERDSRPVHSFARRANSEFFDGQVLVQVYVSHPLSRGGPKTAHVKFDSAEPGITTQEVRSANLQVRLENRSAVAIELDFVDVSSDLADVAAGMQRLKLAPGQSVQTSSVLIPRGATSDPIAVKVSMRLGDREETRDITLPTSTVARADS